MSKTNKTPPSPNFRVSNKYRLIHKIGNGSFGDIYLGENILTSEKFAIKLESTQTRRP